MEAPSKSYSSPPSFAKVLAMHAVPASGEHQPLPNAFSGAVGEPPCCMAPKALTVMEHLPSSSAGPWAGMLTACLA